MIKLPDERYGNGGWVVKARKPHYCDGYRHTGDRDIERGDFYCRVAVWPGDVNTSKVPQIIKLCRDCLDDTKGAAFDVAVRAKREGL